MSISERAFDLRLSAADITRAMAAFAEIVNGYFARRTSARLCTTLMLCVPSALMATWIQMKISKVFSAHRNTGNAIVPGRSAGSWTTSTNWVHEHKCACAQPTNRFSRTTHWCKACNTQTSFSSTLPLIFVHNFVDTYLFSLNFPYLVFFFPFLWHASHKCSIVMLSIHKHIAQWKNFWWAAFCPHQYWPRCPIERIRLPDDVAARSTNRCAEIRRRRPRKGITDAPKCALHMLESRSDSMEDLFFKFHYHLLRYLYFDPLHQKAFMI